MSLAVTSGALTPLCGQPSAKCWVTWLYSYDKSKKTWWAFWHQQMVPCPWLHTVLFLWMPCGFYLTLPQLILVLTMPASRAFTLPTLVGWFGFFFLSIKQKRLRSDDRLASAFSILLFCLFVFLWFIEILLPNFLHDKYLRNKNIFSSKEGVIEDFLLLFLQKIILS